MRRPHRDRSPHAPPRGPRRGAAFVVALALSAAIAGCGGRPYAEGSSRHLVVVTALPEDSPEILLLRAVVEREALRIDHEKSYEIQLVSPDEPRAYRSTNVLLVGYGPFDRVPRAGGKLRELLEDRDEPFAFVPDLWLRGQAAGILWTKTRAEWVPALSRAQNRFYLALDRATFGAVRERVLALPADQRAGRRMRETLGFTLRVPRGYALRVRPAQRAALLLEEGPPARLLRIRALAPGEQEDARSARASLARLFRPNERTLDLADPLLTPDAMAGAVRQMHGRWEDEVVSAAGPFRFYEVKRGARRFQVDLAVFAPGRPKLPYLRELHAIAETLALP